MCAARFSGLGIPTIYRWIRRGYIPATVLQVPRIKVRLKDIRAHIDATPSYAWRRKAGLHATRVLRAKRMERRRRQLSRAWRKTITGGP
jgi:predicted site-specific integrase-resolvase